MLSAIYVQKWKHSNPKEITMEEESIPLAKHHQSYMDDLYESCLGNPFPSESDFCFSEDRLFQIEMEFARSLEHYSASNDIEAILESDSLLVDASQEESPLSLPSAVPGEEMTPIDLLLMCVEAVDARKWEVASGIIMRLNLMLPGKENGNAPFDRLAFYFVQALHLRCSDNVCGMPNVAGPQMELSAGGHNTTTTMCAVLMVQELSPYVKFAHFTANQAILEATWSNRDVHVVDFDITEGIQWPSLMAELAARDGGCSLRITAVIIADPGEAGRTSLTGRRLKEFAGSISLDFMFDQLVISKEEDFLKVEIDSGWTVVANCMSHQVHTPNRSRAMVRTFLNGVTTFMSPKVLVLVQDELHSTTKEAANTSFFDFFRKALHHYTSISESLASGFGCGYETGLKLVEKEILGRRIVDCLRGFPFEEDMSGCGPTLGGYGSSPISDKNVEQAQFLVGLFCRDYRVQHEKGRRMLSLCWRSRPIVTATIWAPTQKTLY